MRSAAIIGLLALLAVGCTTAGSVEVQLEATGEPEQYEPIEPTEPVVEEPRDLCEVYRDMEDISALASRASYEGGLDDDLIAEWSMPLFMAGFGDLARLVPPELAELRAALEAVVDAYEEDPTLPLEQLGDEVLDRLGFDEDEIDRQGDEFFGDVEDRCGPVFDTYPPPFVKDRSELRSHVTQVVQRLWLDSAPDCLTHPAALELVGDALDERPSGSDSLIALAVRCGASEAEAEMFAWLVTDVVWGDTDVFEELAEQIAESPEVFIHQLPIDPDEVAVPELVPEVLVPEPMPVPESTPEVYGYPIEGLVADVLGTLGIVGDEAACLVDAGVYEPASLWLDEPGVNPDVLAQQRSLLDEVAAGCGFSVDQVDEWLRLAHQYVAEVAATE